MSFQDPISDCLTRIRNGLMRGKVEVSAPYSKLKHDLVNVLVAEGYDIGIFGANKDGVDGVFGMMTEKAVRENQQPFATFKSMYPSAVEGQVSADFFNSNIKGQY